VIDSLRTLIFKDLWLKLFSLTLAILFWLGVNLAINKELPLGPPERTVFSNLPVVVLSSADDARTVHVSPKTVEVTVQGDRRVLDHVQARDIRVLVDLTGIGAAHDLRKRIEVTAPAGITYVKVDPEEVQVVFPPKS
jgi:YbbR domain-containing protein